MPGFPWHNWAVLPLSKWGLHAGSPVGVGVRAPWPSPWNRRMPESTHPVHAASVTRSNSVSLKPCWMYACLHPPSSSTCLQWLEKLTLSYILPKDPFFSPPFGHESMGMMKINLFMLFSRSVGLCLCVKIDLGEQRCSNSSVHQYPLESLTKHRFLGCGPQNFSFKLSEVGLKICFSKKVSIMLMLAIGWSITLSESLNQREKSLFFFFCL